MQDTSIPEGAKLIPLSRGYHAIVDAEDYEELSKYKWHVKVKKEGNLYARRNFSHSI